LKLSVEWEVAFCGLKRKAVETLNQQCSGIRRDLDSSG